MDQNSFATVVGSLLRGERLGHGKTRRQVAEELPGEVSPRALEAYESGRRSLTLLKFVQICQVIHADPADVLARATEELGVPGPSSVLVDLRSVLRDDAADLTPLRRWANLMTSGQPYGSPVLWHFTPSAITAMAELCKMPPRRLRRRLQRFETRVLVDGGAS